MYNLKKIGPATYLLPKEGGMRVPGLIIATEKLLKEIDFEKPLEQVRNVAYLPGIVGYSIAMPDIHWGYGFPIGGVAAMDAETGVISPGGVGYDINCGVRLALAPDTLSTSSSDTMKKELLQRIFQLVPSGVGRGHRRVRETFRARLSKALDARGALVYRARIWFPARPGTHRKQRVSSKGQISAPSHLKPSSADKDQLGTIGSGNHFVEIGAVEKIFLPEIAQSVGC